MAAAGSPAKGREPRASGPVSQLSGHRAGLCPLHVQGPTGVPGLSRVHLPPCRGWRAAVFASPRTGVPVTVPSCWGSPASVIFLLENIISVSNKATNSKGIKYYTLSQTQISVSTIFILTFIHNICLKNRNSTSLKTDFPYTILIPLS